MSYREVKNKCRHKKAVCKPEIAWRYRRSVRTLTRYRWVCFLSPLRSTHIYHSNFNKVNDNICHTMPNI